MVMHAPAPSVIRGKPFPESTVALEQYIDSILLGAEKLSPEVRCALVDASISIRTLRALYRSSEHTLHEVRAGRLT